MGSPQAHLPPALSVDIIHNLISSLTLPLPTDIEPLHVTACFHSIYLLNFSAAVAEALGPAKTRHGDGSTTLVLRVSGDHIQGHKTKNEVAMMRWVRENTSVPVPAVVRFDATSQNPVGREFILLEWVPGRSVDKMYGDLDAAVKRKIVGQLTDFVLELNKHEWTHVGGLKVDENERIMPGPLLEETFWMGPDISRFWGSDETFDSLNPTGPYSSHAGLVQGYLDRYIHAIEVHPTLSWLKDLIPRLRTLRNNLDSMGSLSTSRLMLSHRDLHFCNVMATPDGEVTGILDWEFASIVPALRWDPVRAFLWNGQQTEGAAKEKDRLRNLFESELEKRGIERWWIGDSRKEMDEIWTVVSFIRALVEVCPRGQRADKVKGWKSTAQDALKRLGL